MKNKIVTTLLLLITSLTFPAFGQSVPPFQATIYPGSPSGYYFLCPLKIGISGNSGPTHLILDGEGNVVYVKNFANGQNTGDFKLQPNGLISYSHASKFYMMDSTFSIVDSVNCSGVNTDTHDMQILLNGNFLMLGTENTIMDLSGFPLFGINHNLPGSSTASVRSSVVQELDSAKNLVFDWHAKDYFAFLDVDTTWLLNPTLVNWTHSNAIEKDYDGNILLSSRHFNEITKIDVQTGNIIWRLGGNVNMFTFVNDDMQFKRQHDIRRLPNGNITLFDNGDGIISSPYHYAAAKEYQLDETNLTATLTWSYVDDTTENSSAMGNFQRIPGANSLVNYGISPSLNRMFKMINDAGQTVFELSFDDTLSTYRAFYYQALPWNINRPEITCFENAGQYFLDAGPGFASYQWSNGGTTQVIALTSTGTYSVFVPAGQGGFLKSSNFVVYNMADPCGLSTSTEIESGNLELFPNPVVSELNVTITGKINHPVQIFNATGKLIFSVRQSDSKQLVIPMFHLPGGIYILKCGGMTRKIVKL